MEILAVAALAVPVSARVRRPARFGRKYRVPLAKARPPAALRRSAGVA